MQAPFLCLISFLDRCRYPSISYILARIITVPGEYVQLPLKKRMINRRSGKIYQTYSRPLSVPQCQVDRRFPFFCSWEGYPKSFATVPSFLSLTKTAPPVPPVPSNGAVLELINGPSKWILLAHQPGWMSWLLVDWCRIYWFSRNLC